MSFLVVDEILILRWREMARTRRREANNLRARPNPSFVAIACHEARADVYERLVAELELAGEGFSVPAPGAQWPDAEVKQRRNEQRNGL